MTKLLFLPVAQHLVGEDPKEREEMIVTRRQFKGELSLVLGVRAVNQLLRETFAVKIVNLILITQIKKRLDIIAPCYYV